MLRALDQFYLDKEEPHRSCFMALRDVILGMDENITVAWKYRLPFFNYKSKMFCYLWADKKTGNPYIGMVEGNKLNHPLLEKGNRKRMKIFTIDPVEDLPIEIIYEIINEALDLYKNGILKA